MTTIKECTDPVILQEHIEVLEIMLSNLQQECTEGVKVEKFLAEETRVLSEMLINVINEHVTSKEEREELLKKVPAANARAGKKEREAKRLATYKSYQPAFISNVKYRIKDGINIVTAVKEQREKILERIFEEQTHRPGRDIANNLFSRKIVES